MKNEIGFEFFFYFLYILLLYFRKKNGVALKMQCHDYVIYYRLQFRYLEVSMGRFEFEDQVMDKYMIFIHPC